MSRFRYRRQLEMFRAARVKRRKRTTPAKPSKINPNVSWLATMALASLLNSGCRWLTCAIPAPICPPPMIVTCLITTFLTAEDEKPLRTWWVKKAMCDPAVGGRWDCDTDWGLQRWMRSGWRVDGHVIQVAVPRNQSKQQGLWMPKQVVVEIITLSYAMGSL